MVVSLEGNTTGNLLVIATSSFNSHAQAATVTVVAQAVNGNINILRNTL